MIECLGRIDHQVKVRGFRIELGEIETALGQRPDIRENVVVAREDKPGHKRLVGYVVANQANADLAGSSPTETTHWPQLRRFLEGKLPDYMIPSAFVVLDALPRTPNGKVDRKALPAPDTEAVGARNSYVPPANETEKVLTEIWAHVLGLEKVGVRDDVFDLGGDSILIFQIATRATQAGLKLSPAQLFRHRTITELAKEVENEKSVKPSGSQPIMPVSREGRQRRVVR